MPKYFETEVARLVESIGHVLTGRPSPLQGAVLADLLATWLAGHIIHDSPAETRAMRARLLEQHIATVKKLVPLNSETIHGRKD